MDSFLSRFRFILLDALVSALYIHNVLLNKRYIISILIVLFFSLFRWTYLLFQVFSHYLFTPSVPLYDQVKWTVILFQNAAVLEVVHAATGLVRANPVLTAFQVASRVIVVCGILMATEAPRHSIGLALALLAWSVTEIIRYSMYTLSLLGQAPYFLTWLR